MIDDATVGRVALLAEHLLRHPDRDRLIAAFRDQVPAAELDQLDATARDLHAVVDHVAETSGGEYLVVDRGSEPPSWVLLGLCATFAGWHAGRGACCEHTVDPRVAQPLAAAAWKPGLVVCLHCSHLLELPRGSVADRTCDACGRVCAGSEHGDGVWPSTVVLGSIAYSVGVCCDCKWTEEAAA